MRQPALPRAYTASLPTGKATIIFQPQELQVQALQVGPGGVIYAATAPDGKVYKIEHKPGAKSEPAKSENKTAQKARQKILPSLPLDPSWSSSEYFAPGTKYIWDLALDKTGNLYVATGDHGEIYKVTPKGEHSVFFKSDETHIRVLALDAQGNMIAGTDGSGLVYRISPAGRRVRPVQRSEERNHRAGSRSRRQYLCRRRGRKACRRWTNTCPQALPLMVSIGTTRRPCRAADSWHRSRLLPVLGRSHRFRFPAAVRPAVPTFTGSERRLAILRIWTSREDIVYALAFDSHDKLLCRHGKSRARFCHRWAR